MQKVIEHIDKALAYSSRLSISPMIKQQIVYAKNEGEILNARLVKSLDWMVQTMKFKHDGTGIAAGAYSPELLEAIKLLEELQSVR